MGQSEQPAIQSPRGGTKVAWDSWDGTPVAPKAEPNRQLFELLAANSDQQAAVDALTSLGATRLDDHDNGTAVLADPDGNEFYVRPTGRRPAESLPRPG